MSDKSSMMQDASIVLAQPRGFCAGVDRAISIVERALEQFGAPIYVRHEIVHNKYVVDDLKHKGAVFIEELHEAPDGSTVIFSRTGSLALTRMKTPCTRSARTAFKSCAPVLMRAWGSQKRSPAFWRLPIRPIRQRITR